MATKKAVGRIVHFANLPLKLLIPSSRENITEVAFKTIPSASKVSDPIPLVVQHARVLFGSPISRSVKI